MTTSSNACAKHIDPKLPILISSATGNIGSEVSKNLASKGNNLLLLGRNKEKLEKLSAEITKQHKVSVQVFVADFDDIQSVQAATDKMPHVKSMLIIGPRPMIKKQEMPTPAEWQASLTRCFISPLEVIRSMHDKIHQHGSVVIFSGITSKLYLPAYRNTNVIRVMWDAEVSNLVNQFADKKVRFNTISPGMVLTQYFKNRAKDQNLTMDEYVAENSTKIPLGRVATIDDVTNVVEFLISSKSSFINGQNILLDGGRHTILN